jgi:hypothetical protein
MPKIEKPRPSIRISITVSGDRDIKVVEHLKTTYGPYRMPVKIMDAANAFFSVFAIDRKKGKKDKEVICAAQESIALLESQVKSILWKLQSEGIDTSWYDSLNSPPVRTLEQPQTSNMPNETTDIPPPDDEDDFTIEL